MRIFGGFSRATAAVLDTYTTIVGRSWVPILDTTDIRWRIFDGVTPGGIKMARLDEVEAIAPIYRYETPTTGATITLVVGDRIVLINPAAIIAALTITLAAGSDKKRITIATRQRIDLLTINGVGGNSVDWVANELPQNGRLDFLFVSPITTWVQS